LHLDVNFAEVAPGGNMSGVSGKRFKVVVDGCLGPACLVVLEPLPEESVPGSSVSLTWSFIFRLSPDF
jgi:hypothetical protein